MIKQFILLAALGLFLNVSVAQAQSTPTCAGAGDAGNSYESCASGVCESLICNGSAFVTQSAWAHAGWQSIKFGNDTSTCNTGRTGRMRYDGSDTWEYCDGVSWTRFALIGNKSNLTCWGQNWYLYQTGIPARFKSLTAGTHNMYGVFTNDRVGSVSGNEPNMAYVDDNDLVAKVVVGNYNTACTLITNGTVKCTDASIGTTWNTAWTSGLTNVIDLDISYSNGGNGGGAGHGCAVLSNGNLDCDGYTDASGESTDRTGVNAVKVAVGQDHTCIINTSGAVQCWGTPTMNNGTPYTGNFASQIAAGGAGGHATTCVVVSNTGGVRCWGGNHGSGVYSPPAMTDAVKVAVNQDGDSACAARTSGVSCWGTGSFSNNGILERTLASAGITTATDIVVSYAGKGCAITSN